jgi:hypothetical protein
METTQNKTFTPKGAIPKDLVTRFLEEARDESPTSGYKLYKSTKMLTIWRKKIGSENLYRVKMVGYLKYPIELVKQVVFDNKNRISWDSVLEEIRELGPVNESQRLVHFITKPKYGKVHT